MGLIQRSPLFDPLEQMLQEVNGKLGNENFYPNSVDAGKVLLPKSVTSKEWKPQSGLAQASSTLSVTPTRQDVPGCTLTFTPTYDSIAMIWGTLDFYIANAEATWESVLAGYLLVNGVLNNRIAEFRMGNATAGTVLVGEATTGCLWYINLAARVTTTIKLQANRTDASGAGLGTYECRGGSAYGTQLMYLVHAA